MIADCGTARRPDTGHVGLELAVLKGRSRTGTLTRGGRCVGRQGIRGAPLRRAGEGTRPYVIVMEVHSRIPPLPSRI